MGLITRGKYSACGSSQRLWLIMSCTALPRGPKLAIVMVAAVLLVLPLLFDGSPGEVGTEEWILREPPRLKTVRHSETATDVVALQLHDAMESASAILVRSTVDDLVAGAQDTLSELRAARDEAERPRWFAVSSPQTQSNNGWQ